MHDERRHTLVEQVRTSRLRGRKNTGTKVTRTRTAATQYVFAKAAAPSTRPWATAAGPSWSGDRRILLMLIKVNPRATS